MNIQATYQCVSCGHKITISSEEPVRVWIPCIKADCHGWMSVEKIEMNP